MPLRVIILLEFVMIIGTYLGGSLVINAQGRAYLTLVCRSVTPPRYQVIDTGYGFDRTFLRGAMGNYQVDCL